MPTFVHGPELLTEDSCHCTVVPANASAVKVGVPVIQNEGLLPILENNQRFSTKAVIKRDQSIFLFSC